jgi:glutaredoxin 3
MQTVRVYTTDYCGYCRRAKALLDKKGIPYQEIDCTNDPQTRQWLVERSGMRTVPQIFFGDVPIGGFDELYELERAGELDRMVATP